MLRMPGLSSLREIEPRRIAILKPSSLGDIVHALPVLTAVRERFPTAHLTWIVNKTYEPLLVGHPHLDATLPFDRSAGKRMWLGGARTFATFLGTLRRQDFDLILDLQGLLRSGIMTYATGAARRVGLSTAREGAIWFYTDIVRTESMRAGHAVERYLGVARALGAKTAPVRFIVPIADAARNWAGEQLRGCPRPWMALGAGARWQTKRWPAEHFAELARRAQERHGGTVLFVGGSEESALASAIAPRLPGPTRDLTGRTTLPQLAALLADVDVMIANDTGPLHLAAALGRPVVAPYTCTKVDATGPYGYANGAVESTVWCQGSFIKRCRRMECMRELTPDRLWPALAEVLRRCPRSSLSA
jgi:lipopolysaccharide heptosyltransferase I